MNEFEVIVIDASTPFERGVQYGKAAADKIIAGIANYRKFFEDKGQPWETTTKLAMAFVPDIEEAMPEVLEEAKGVAEGAGVSFEGLMVLNTRYELTNYPIKPAECTTGAVLPEATKDHVTYMIKNWDYRVGVLDKIVLLHIIQEDGTRIFGLTEAGQLLREGFNNHGIGLCNNMIASVYDGPGGGIPVCFLRRKVLACRTFDEAYGWITGIKRSVSNNSVLVSGSENRAIDIEASPVGCDLIKPIAGIVTHANHFSVDPDKDTRSLVSMWKNRQVRMADLLYHEYGNITVESIMEIMKDHEYYPDSICNHSNSGDPHDMKGMMTVASIIVDFANQCSYVCKGNPCQGTYKRYDI